MNIHPIILTLYATYRKLLKFRPKTLLRHFTSRLNSVKNMAWNHLHKSN